VRNSSVKWGNNLPGYFAHALESHGVPLLKVSNLDGAAAFPQKLKAKLMTK
jgi:hypothetical protein